MSPPHDPAHGTLHPAPGPRTRRSSAVMPLGRVRRCWRHPRLARGRENLAGGAALETVRSPGCRTGTALVDGRFRTRAGHRVRWMSMGGRSAKAFAWVIVTVAGTPRRSTPPTTMLPVTVRGPVPLLRRVAAAAYTPPSMVTFGPPTMPMGEVLLRS